MGVDVKAGYLLVMIFFASLATCMAKALPKPHDRVTYYIDPQLGNDKNNGTTLKAAWKTFAPTAMLTLSAGDQLNIIKPGIFHETLVIHASGTKQRPVKITFAPGKYDIYADKAVKKQFNISNTNDDPLGLKSIVLYIEHSNNVVISARGARIVLRNKMIETCIDSSRDVTIKGIAFDYARPTVSELTVTDVGTHFADLKINRDSKYIVKNDTLLWVGEGRSSKPGWYWQELNLQTDELKRKSLELKNVRFEDKGHGIVRAVFETNPGFLKGNIYQNRDVTRDCAGMFLQRSRNITLSNVRIYYMHGMGVVSQFCNNITIDSLSVKPDKKSGRTCAAWADILHFSGCRGKIQVSNSYLSGANDDAINVHGTFLRIIGKPAQNQLKVRFMHDQTYGFNAFESGDSVQLVHAGSLQPFGHNVVTTAVQLTPREILLTFKDPVSDGVLPDDVVENTTYTPQVHIFNTTITRIPTRGILVTSPRNVLIDHNRFLHTQMSAILIADDATSWYESGAVRDVHIHNNQFINCGEPVISIHPENEVSNGFIHRNISVINNRFYMTGKQLFALKSTENINLEGNTIYIKEKMSLESMIKLTDCSNVKTGSNKVINY